MIRSLTNACLLAVISLLFGVISPSIGEAAIAPAFQTLGQISSGLRGPLALDLDDNGTLYVADSRHQVVVKFDKYGNELGTLSAVPTSGAGLAVAADGTVYVSAWDKVAVYDVAGDLAGYLGQGAGEFGAAGDIGIDANGKIYVVDKSIGRIKVFAPGSSVGAIFGGLNFSGSIDLAVDAVNNRIYIANYTIDRFTGAVPTLYIYNTSGLEEKRVLASNGFGAPILAFGDVAFDNAGRYYLSDFNQGTIRVVDMATGTVLASFGLGTLSHPASMAFDAATQRLFVLYGDVRVDIFGIDGGQNPANVNTPPTVPVPLTFGEIASATPDLLFENASDEEGDSLNYNVQVLGDDGALVSAFAVAEDTGATLETLAVVDVTLAENASYSWQVQADDGRATSAWSAPLSFDVNAVEEAPSAPVLDAFLVGETAGIDAELSWSASTDADPNAAVSYRVEIYDGAVPVATGLVADTRAAVLGLSETLTPGRTYSWKVVAVDNTALETSSLNSGSFVFQISVLKVDANVPGSKVYLTGHHGYAGRLLGIAPLEIRALAAGDYSIAVEAAGFEPYLTTASIIKDAQTEVVVKMQGATVAADFATHDLNLAGLPVQGAGVAPIVADLNHDGVLDLLLALNGQVEFYAGSLALDPHASDTIEDLLGVKNNSLIDRVVFAAAAQPLGLPQISGAAPCLVDWDNDDLLDLLVGGADGSVKLFRGQGGTTFAATGEWLVTVAGQALPAVADLDADGDKDLIVASGTELVLFDNVGSDSLPLLNSSTLLASLTAPAVPLFADWNAEGARELMLLSQGELFQALMGNGVVSGLVSTGLNVGSATSVFVLNVANSNHKDLLFATASGALLMANGTKGAFAPAYVQAVHVKLAEAEGLVALEAPERLDMIASITKQINRENYASAKEKAELLVDLLGAETSAGVAVTELVWLLK